MTLMLHVLKNVEGFLADVRMATQEMEALVWVGKHCFME